MEFVTFELAKKLREKGFREECLCHYIGKDLFYNIESPIANNQLWFSHNNFDNIWHRDNYDAPTISQVLKWLREEKKIHIQIIVYENGWYFEIWQYDGTPAIFKYQGNKDYHSYEQTAIAGVNYCLDNLI